MSRRFPSVVRLPEWSPLVGRPMLLSLVAVSLAVAAVNESGSLVEVGRDMAGGVAFLCAGLLLWRRGRDPIGNLMIMIAIGWFLGGTLHRGPLAHLLLSYPSGILSPAALALVVLAYVDGVVESVVQSDLASLLFSLGLVLAAGARLILGARQAAEARRLAFVGSLMIAVVLGGGATARLAGVRLADAQLLAYEFTLVTVAIALTAFLAWRRSPDALVPEFVVELGRSSPVGLRDRLARLLGDPSLVLGFAVGDPPRYVDERGEPVDLAAAPGRVVTFINDQGARVGVVVHDADVLADEATLRGVSAATKIALDNLHLRDEVMKRTDTLEASRRRLANSVEMERKRLSSQIDERVVSRLRRAHQLVGDVRGDEQVAAEIDDLRHRLEAAGIEVRAVARGALPNSLVENGLAAAIDELVQAVGVPVQVSLPSEPLPSAVEATLYYVCAEALTNVAKHARSSHVGLTISFVAGKVRVLVVDDGVGGADPSGAGLVGLRARVSAAGGKLRVISPMGAGTVVEAEMPLG